MTVIALPISLTASLFGMNVGGVPFNEHPAGYWVVASLVVLVTSLAAWLVLRLRES